MINSYNNNNNNLINNNNNNSENIIINNDNNNEYDSYNNFIFKREFLKRLNLIDKRNEEEYKNFVIENLYDIAQLQLLFCQQVPLENVNQYDYSLESVIERILIKNQGGVSSHLNVIFSLFLNELGINCRLIKIDEKSKFNNIFLSNPHYSIIIQWDDGNEYLIDVGLGIYNCYQPLELGSTTPKIHSSKHYRIRKFNDGFIYEEKLIEEHIYNPVFHFNRKQQKENLTFDDILNISNNNYNKNINNNNNNRQYLFKLYEKGYYYIHNNKFFIKNYYNDSKNNEITITDNNQFKKISLKYFNILIK
ncbi:hypothetical protein DICPUDRAFT_81051 [Dictyostelium purpureum]|uniref:Uncharacterized protein n=1 Tax=Dictyostelium purpureum TaxID=5786 RepID=F0ZSB9_DICPU|nr:uncharacterized protein DICPUDRAFT_81051 [Dictyostelium purpureum]EGC33153.1 hypothetical protein DICPUDRAFT_81051 [Dictyostelium purpureum]|eukprot:XP_003290309.1 hypothetical protein DICPUDRAFT_81051 [Dictyostelium purpureum]